MELQFLGDVTKERSLDDAYAFHGANALHTPSPSHLTTVISLSSSVFGNMSRDRTDVLADSASDIP